MIRVIDKSGNEVYLRASLISAVVIHKDLYCVIHCAEFDYEVDEGTARKVLNLLNSPS